MANHCKLKFRLTRKYLLILLLTLILPNPVAAGEAQLRWVLCYVATSGNTCIPLRHKLSLRLTDTAETLVLKVDQVYTEHLILNLYGIPNSLFSIDQLFEPQLYLGQVRVSSQTNEALSAFGIYSLRIKRQPQFLTEPIN